MQKGRINERNTGSHKLDGGAKRAKASKESLTDEQLKAKEVVTLCKMILKDGVKLYEHTPELVQHWIDQGIAMVRVFENTCIPARAYKPLERRAILNEKKRSNVELVQGLIVSFFKLKIKP